MDTCGAGLPISSVSALSNVDKSEVIMSSEIMNFMLNDRLIKDDLTGEKVVMFEK